MTRAPRQRTAAARLSEQHPMTAKHLRHRRVLPELRAAAPLAGGARGRAGMAGHAEHAAGAQRRARARPRLRIWLVLPVGAGEWRREVLGIDVSEKMLARARETTSDPAIEYRRATSKCSSSEPARSISSTARSRFHYVENFRGSSRRCTAGSRPAGASSSRWSIRSMTAPRERLVGERGGGKNPGWSITISTKARARPTGSRRASSSSTGR